MKGMIWVLVVFIAFQLGVAGAAVGDASVSSGWSIPCGLEFWQADNSLQQAGPGAEPLKRICDRVRHALTEEMAVGESPIESLSYFARVMPRGFVFTPREQLLSGDIDGRFSEESIGVSELIWELDSIRVDGCKVDLTDPETYSVGNTRQLCWTGRQNCYEHLSFRSEGAQVVWWLEEVPRTFEVQCRFEGYTVVPDGAGVLSLRGPDGEERIQISQAVLVDATGRRKAMNWEAGDAEGTFKLIADATMLKGMQAPICIDPVVSSSLLLSERKIPSVAFYDQVYPRIAYGLTNSLVVWGDYRNGWYINDQEIFGVRLGPDGEILDPTSIAICFQPYPQKRPDVCWADDHFQVAWEDGRNMTNYVIYGARISEGGEVLDAAGVKIGDAPNARNQYRVRLASAPGENCLAAWHDLRNGNNDVYGRRIDLSGQPLGSADITICTASNQQQDVSLAWGGTNYFVVWEDHRNFSGLNLVDLYGTRINPAGEVLNLDGQPVSAYNQSQYSPDVCWAGTNYFVAWSDARLYSTSNRYDIYATLVRENGTVMYPNGFSLCVAPSNQSAPAIVRGETNLLVTWVDFRTGESPDLYGTPVDFLGEPLYSNGTPLITQNTNGVYFPATCWNGESYGLVWQEELEGDVDDSIFYTGISVGGAVSDTNGTLISVAADHQEHLDAAWGATNYLVVWEDEISLEDSDIYGSRVSDRGELLDPMGLAICTVSNKQDYPSVAWGSSNFLVAWEDAREKDAEGGYRWEDLYAARVTDGGIVLETNGIPVCTNMAPQMTPDVAWGDSVFLVAWVDFRDPTPPYPSDIIAARVNEAGQVLDPLGIAVTSAGNNQFDPRVCWGGTNFMAVWEDFRSGISYVIYGARISEDGQVLDASGVQLSNSSTNASDPDVTWGGTNYFVVWEDRRLDPDAYSIYGSRVNQSGQKIDASDILVGTGENDQDNPRVASYGSEYLVVWENANGFQENIAGSILDNSGQRVTSDSAGFIILSNNYAHADPVLAACTNGVFLMAHSSFTLDGFNAMRAAATFIDVQPPQLTVISEHGASSPPAGTNDVVRGLAINCMLLANPATEGSTQFVSRGWVGTGSVPASGTTTGTPVFYMDDNSTITWLWETNYQLSVEVWGVGSVDWTNGWFAYGTQKVLNASSGDYYYFAGWSGDLASGQTNDNPLTVVMSQPRMLQVAFDPFTTSNGVPHWWLAQYDLSTNDATAYLDPDQDEQLTWEEFIGNSNPTNRSSRFAMLGEIVQGPNGRITLHDTLTNRFYGVLWSTNDPDDAVVNWSVLYDQVPGTDGDLELTVTNPGTRGMYRFKVE